MQINKLTYEVVINCGNYQSIRLGGEWSVTTAPTEQQLVELDRELRAKINAVIADRAAAVAPAEDKRELVPCPSDKFKAILAKIQNGTPEAVVREYFRFDEAGEKVLHVAFSDLCRGDNTNNK